MAEDNPELQAKLRELDHELEWATWPLSPDSPTPNICPVQANSEANRKETLHRKGIPTDIPPRAPLKPPVAPA
ncbi:MAG: hypothetical protein LQ347_003998 [Umbilicaria vellea]|nr:MAG: hypothetical protein LQ347_003998 [Umbilicaria vellea]